MPDSAHIPAAIRILPPRNGQEDAARALDQHKLVAMPTETVMGLTFDARSSDALARLRAARTRLRPSATPAQLNEPSTWHAPSAQRVIAILPLATPLAQRALAQLMPGPITLALELAPADMARALQTLQVSPGVIDDGRALLIRIPDHAVASALAQSSTIAAEAIPTTTGPASSAATAAGALEAAGVDCELVIDAPGVAGRISTLVRLPLAGGFRIEREGALAASAVRAKLERRVLFVCTGNTCRSPMAQAIAQALIEPLNKAAPGSVPLVFSSAGLAGSGNQPTSHETIEALKHLAIEAHAGTSRQLTPAMIDQAEAIYAMSPSHAAGIISMVPSAKSKVKLLDPAGGAVPDPIGCAQSVYDALARTMKPMIAARLNELRTTTEPKP